MCQPGTRADSGSASSQGNEALGPVQLEDQGSHRDSPTQFLNQDPYPAPTVNPADIPCFPHFPCSKNPRVSTELRWWDGWDLVRGDIRRTHLLKYEVCDCQLQSQFGVS
jgi:hypothetical protein